jgi:hypothetical protein
LTRGPEKWRVIQRLSSWSRNSVNYHSKSKRIKKCRKFPIPLALLLMRIEKIRRLSSLEKKINKRRLKISQSEGIRQFNFRWPTSKEHLYPDPLLCKSLINWQYSRTSPEGQGLKRMSPGISDNGKSPWFDRGQQSWKTTPT